MGVNKSIAVMQVASGLQAGGLERVVVNLANALADTGYDSHLLCTRRQGKLFSDVSDNVHTWCSKRRYRWDLAGIRKIAAYIDSHRIDLVHTHNHHSSYLLRIGLRFCKHKPVHVVHDHHGPVLYNRKLTFYDWLFLRHVDAYIAVTEELRERASKLLGFREDRCLFLVNGIKLYEPNKQWGSRPEDAPPSMSDGSRTR